MGDDSWAAHLNRKPLSERVCVIAYNEGFGRHLKN